MRTYLLATTATMALLAATSSTHAQTRDWTGQVSSNWFDGFNWAPALFPRQTDDANINTVTPNPTVISDRAHKLKICPSVKTG
jgi:hypothetical protein